MKISKINFERPRNETIDVFRGIAIFMVVSIHTGQAFAAVLGVRPETQNFFELGNYGVQLFFVISGFLLSNIYGGEHLTSYAKRDNTNNFDISTYFRHRIARIAPLWVLFLMVVVLQGLFFNFGPFRLAQRNRQFTWSEFKSVEPTDFTFFIVLTGIAFGLSFLLWTNTRFEDTVVPGGWSIQSEVCNYFFFFYYVVSISQK